MIRRALWLIAGAALGIAGYRRLTALVRAATAGRRASPATRGGRPLAGTAGFVRDVRAGMAEYMDRHRDV